MGIRCVATIMAFLLQAGCGNKAPPPPPPPTVAAAIPLQRDVVDWDDYVGRFEAIQDVQVRPRVSGRSLAIGFRDGQRGRARASPCS